MSPHRNIRLFSWFNFFSDFRPYGPIAILYFAQITGSYALGLSVFSIVSISSLLFELPTGIFSDLIGRKKTIMFGALASVFAISFFAMGTSFWTLAIGAVFGGLADSFFSGNNDAFVYDSLNEEKKSDDYAHVSGRLSSMFQLGLGVSALVGSVFASFSLHYVMWISVIPQLACLVLSFFFVEPKIHTNKVETNVFSHLKEALMKFKENARLRSLSLVSMIDFGIGEVLHQLLPAFLKTVWPLWGLGVAKSISNICGFIGFRYAGAMIKKASLVPSLIGGWIFTRGLVIIAAFFPTVLSPILISISSLFFGLRIVALDTFIQKEFSDKQRATMGSLNRLGANLFFALFAYLFGLFADTIGPANSLIIGQTILLMVLWMYWRLLKKAS